MLKCIGAVAACRARPPSGTSRETIETSAACATAGNASSTRSVRRSSFTIASSHPGRRFLPAPGRSRNLYRLRVLRRTRVTRLDLRGLDRAALAEAAGRLDCCAQVQALVL